MKKFVYPLLLLCLIQISDALSQKVGLNIQNPQEKLHVHSKLGRSYIQITDSASDTTEFQGLLMGLNGFGTAYLYQMEDNHMLFGTNALPRFSIMKDGKVGIGTQNPLTSFHVAGTSSQMLRISSSSIVNGIELVSNGDSPDWKVATAGNYLDFSVSQNNLATSSILMTLRGTGNLGVGNTAPTARMDIRGENTTSNTLAMRIQNSSSAQLMSMNNAGNLTLGATNQSTHKLYVQGSTKTSSLEVSGNVKMDNLAVPSGFIERPVYSDENGNLSNYREMYASVHPLDFRSPGGASVSEYEAYKNSNSSTIPIYAPIHIPDGAIITQVQVVYKDDSADDLEIVITRRSTGTSGAVFDEGGSLLQTSGASSNNRILSRSTGITVNYKDWYYYLKVRPKSGSQWDAFNTLIRNVRIRYIY